jgi:enoyl-CoA hydratase
VVEPGEAVAEAEGLMKVFLSKGPIAVRLAMEAVYRGMDMPFAEGCNLEANLFGQACASEDMKEGTGAFLDKRKAEFKNK